jgi:DNA-binding response OmpR family regulator
MAAAILPQVRVLLVEDEAELAEIVARGLRFDGLAVDIAGDGRSAIAKLDVNEYDLLILDRGLPGVHGDEVCRIALRAARPPRVLMLTADDAIASRVDGLRLGADDYLTKPFAFTELLARIEALMRRPTARHSDVVAVGDLRVDIGRREVHRGPASVALTRKEFWVLVELLRADGAVRSAEDLLEAVWDERADLFTNAVRTVIKNLRAKLGEPTMIETVVGSGYRIAGPRP